MYVVILYNEIKEASTENLVILKDRHYNKNRHINVLINQLAAEHIAYNRLFR